MTGTRIQVVRRQERPSGERLMRLKRTAILVAVASLLAAALLQAGLDRTPAGTAGQKGDFPSAQNLVRFLGGIRQYLAYTFFIKTDKLYHLYGYTGELVPYFLLITYLDPHYVDAYHVASDLVFSAGKKEEAYRLVERGIALNPDSADLFFDLADMHLQEKRFREAKESYEKALALEPRLVSRFMILRGLEVVNRRLGLEEDTVRFMAEEMVSNRMRLYSAAPEEVPALVERINEYAGYLLPEGR